MEPTIVTINGQDVEVDPNFKNLSEAEQHATIEHIAKGMSESQPVPKPEVPPTNAGAPLIGAGLGATTGAVGSGASILYKLANKAEEQAIPSSESAGQKYAAKTGYGVGEGETVREVSEAWKEQNAPRGSGKVTSTMKGAWSPDEILQQAAQREADEARFAKIRNAERLAQQAEARYAPINKLATFKPVTGAAVGANIADLTQQIHADHPVQAGISTAGLIGSALPFIKKLPPKVRAIGAGLSVLSPVANRVIDATTQPAPEQHAAGGAIKGYANLGAVEKIGKGALQMFERAPAKSKEEIAALAQRMAPQVLGEYIPEAGGKSLKQFQREKELQHVVTPNIERTQLDYFDPEKHIGSIQVGVPGDISRAHETLHEVAGRPLNQPTVMQGGPLYGLEGNFWASNLSPARGLQNIVTQSSEAYKGAPVIASTMKMPMGMDYAQHYADALVNNIDYSKTKNLEDFNDIIRKGIKGKTFPDFAGIENPDIALAQMQKNPALRTHFNDTMSKDTITSQFGLPPGRDVLHAVSEPDLINLETGAGGKAIGEMVPSAKLLPSEHPTYSHDIAGKLIGTAKYPMPYELQYPDMVNYIRQNPITYTTKAGQEGTVGEFGRLKMMRPRQIIDPQYADEIQQYQEQMKSLTGMKKGGLAHLAGGKLVEDAVKKFILPAAENASRTQIIGTLPTYAKAADILAQRGAKGQAIDFGAGLGKGAAALGEDTHTYEPFAKDWAPTFTKPEDIPTDAYGRLTNLNVLNVVPREARDEIVQHIGRVMEPGGLGILTTRGADVMGAKGVAGPEPMSIITSRDTYQKGFTKQELEDYMKYMLGDKFDVNKLNLGPAGVLIQKKAAGGEILKKLLPLAEREANKAKFLEGNHPAVPDVVYHATRTAPKDQAIDQMIGSKYGTLGSGTYTTPDTKFGSTYTGIPTPETIEELKTSFPAMARPFVKGMEEGDWSGVPMGGYMMPLHPSVKNPLILEGAHPDPAFEALGKLGVPDNKIDSIVEKANDKYGSIGKEIQSRAQKAGHDAVMLFKDGNLQEMVTYSPNQLKSALGNEGTFNPYDPRLSKKHGGKVKKKKR